MSQSSKYIPAGLTPGPDFRVAKGGDGRWSGSMSFTAEELDSGDLVLGRPITEFYETLGPSWEFLIVTGVEAERQPGGIHRIVMSFSGLDTGKSEPQGADKNKSGTFTMNGTLIEVPLSQHWRWRDLTGAVQDPLLAWMKGDARLQEGTTDEWILISNDGTQEEIYRFYFSATDNPYELKDTDLESAFALLIYLGVKTFLAPSVEWAQTFVNKGPLESSDYDQLDYIDDNPAGPPPTFEGRNWRLVSIEQTFENITGDGSENTTTFTKTWALSPPGEEWSALLYTKPEP